VAVRITSDEQSAIAAAARQTWERGVVVSLFGSRTDDAARGGDIDLLVDLPEPPTPAEWVAQRQAFVARLYRRLGERRIDVLLAGPAGGVPAAVLASARQCAITLVRP
jgi:predicted nucleotidyltransferase